MKRSCDPSSRRTPRAERARGRVFVFACGLAACDRGVALAPEDVRPVHVVDVNVGPGKPLQLGDAIVVSFDRYLDPSSATRQSFAVLDGFGQLTATPLIAYDPETRTVRISAAGDSWLLADQPYTLVLGIPAAGEELGGVRGLDGGTLTPEQNLRIAFFARARHTEASADAPVSFCEHVRPLFARACVGCHDGSTSGLDLRSAASIQRTAIGKLARGQNRLATAEPSGLSFENAALLAPPSAATSYLLSKVLLREPSSAEAAQSRAFCTDPPPPAERTEVTVKDDPGDQERALLGTFVAGQAMPPPDSAVPALSLHERRLLSRWIREGAPLDSCSESCP